MTIKDIETRVAEIRSAMTSEDADLKSLIEEAKELKTRKEEIIAETKAQELEVEHARHRWKKLSPEKVK